jgi:hypothetical protein
MTTLGSRSHRRLSVFTFIGILLLSAAIAGCSQQGTAAQLDQNAPIVISTRATVITIQNNAGMALNDVKLTVIPYGNVAFTKTFSRLENAETRDVQLNELMSRDGTAFNPRLSNPKLIRVSAADTVGKRYDLERPWK